MLPEMGVARRLPLLVLAALLAAGVGPAQAADPVTIQVIASETGAGSLISNGGVALLRSFEDSVNKSGGIRGRPLQFVFHDDTSNPQVAVQIANTLMDQNVVFDLASAGECSAILPLLKSGPVHYCTSNGVHPPPGSYMFTAAMWSTAMITADLRYFRERGFTKIALITSTDATGQDAERAIDETLADPANKTLKIVARQHFNITDFAVDAQMARLKAADPDLLIAWSTGTGMGTLLRGAQAVGLSLPTLTTAGNLTQVQMKQYATLLPAELYFAGVPAVTTEAAADRATRGTVLPYLNAVRMANLPVDWSTSVLWDPAELIVAALRKYGPDVKPDQLRDYLAGLKGWSGIYGTYDFPTFPQRGLGPDNVVVVRWDAAKQGWVAVSTAGGVPLAREGADAKGH